MPCTSLSRVCVKFIICCIISFATTALGIILISFDRFQNQAISTFATNLIILNLTFWLEPPKFAIIEKKEDLDNHI